MLLVCRSILSLLVGHWSGQSRHIFVTLIEQTSADAAFARLDFTDGLFEYIE